MHLIDIEICSNCGREIGRLEQAYVFEGKIVCAECDNALRTSRIADSFAPPEPPDEPPAEQEPTTTIEPQSEEPDLPRPDEQENDINSGDVDRHPGLIIAGIILCIIGIFLIGLGFLGLVVSFLAGILIGILPTGLFLTLGILITISGIAAIIIAATSH